MTMVPIDLRALPSAAALRNTALVDIGAEYKGPTEKIWRKVLPSSGIARKTFNELGLDERDWRATKDPDAWDEERIDIIGQNGPTGDHYDAS